MTNTRFSARSDEDVTRFVAANPLAFVVTGAAGNADTTLLPLRPERINAGRIATLAGHYPRANPQVAQLQAEPRASLLFLGPHGYVSPSWFADRTQAYWKIAIAGYAINLVAVPALAFVGTWQAAAALIIVERAGKASRLRR